VAKEVTVEMAKDELRARQARERAELLAVQAAERAAEGIDETPLATWNASSLEELTEVVAGVTRMDTAASLDVVHRLDSDTSEHEFTTGRHGLTGELIGGARWRAERAGVSNWKLRLLAAEPEGVT
jgi:hypothetical protein